MFLHSCFITVLIFLFESAILTAAPKIERVSKQLPPAGQKLVINTESATAEILNLKIINPSGDIRLVPSKGTNVEVQVDDIARGAGFPVLHITKKTPQLTLEIQHKASRPLRTSPTGVVSLNISPVFADITIEVPETLLGDLEIQSDTGVVLISGFKTEPPGGRRVAVQCLRGMIAGAEIPATLGKKLADSRGSGDSCQTSLE